jgi:four helix bundle protein
MHGSYRELRVWQEAMKLTVAVYRATEGFPKHELYGLTSQIRRAAVSVPSNIAEGKGRHSAREFIQFLLHSRGSLLELETQIILAEQLQYVSAEVSSSLQGQTTVIARGLNALINAFRRQLKSSQGEDDQRLTTND